MTTGKSPLLAARIPATELAIFDEWRNLHSPRLARAAAVRLAVQQICAAGSRKRPRKPNARPLPPHGIEISRAKWFRHPSGYWEIKWCARESALNKGFAPSIVTLWSGARNRRAAPTEQEWHEIEEIAARLTWQMLRFLNPLPGSRPWRSARISGRGLMRAM